MAKQSRNTHEFSCEQIMFTGDISDGAVLRDRVASINTCSVYQFVCFMVGWDEMAAGL